MKLAIHYDDNTFSFSKRWIEYCENNKIDYTLVNCYDSDIIEQMQAFDALLWNWNNNDYKAKKFARQLIYSVENMSKKVFPNTKTCWHYDDKIGQKYLLEAIEAPIVPTYIFYNKKSAFLWIEQTNFPKVFKLSTGSGATNVQLANNEEEAKKLVEQSFGKGFSQMNRISNFKDKFSAWRRDKNKSTSRTALRAFVRVFVPTEFENMEGKELGYAYFQEFIPNNTFDIRVITIGDKAFAIKRMCRQGDFRASGSGIIKYEKQQIDERCVRIALDISKKITTQSTAYDFVTDINNNPLIVEISYAFAISAYDACQGYWDKDLNWYEGKFNPQNWMIEDLINSL